MKESFKREKQEWLVIGVDAPAGAAFDERALAAALNGLGTSLPVVRNAEVAARNMDDAVKNVYAQGISMQHATAKRP
jgi:hypothetical protein